jgi:hypothetical protein
MSAHGRESALRRAQGERLFPVMLSLSKHVLTMTGGA